jgi:molybdopterin/thiamine biosynthesis adenylyltransferase
MITTLVLSPTVSSEVEWASRQPLETAGVLLARLAVTDQGNIRLLGHVIRWVAEDAYLDRQEDSLSIASHGYVPALAEAERTGSIPLWIHTHPGENANPKPSKADFRVDAEIADLFRLRSGSLYYGTVIFSPRRRDIAFSGTLQHEEQPTLAIDRLWRVGDDWRLLRAVDSIFPEISPVFDRNVRAFGNSIQLTLGDLRVAIIGCGGTGSAVAEQLVRLGVRHLTLVDADRLSKTNITRVYGSTPDAEGKLKAYVLRDHLTAIAPDLLVQTVISMLTLEPAARKLPDHDLVFGCTDDNAGRLVLSRFASYFLAPVVDVGVLLSSDADDILVGIDGRITVLTPGAACLVCRDRVDLRRAAAELMTPEERQKLADEGYAPALAGVEPAVVAFTAVAAAAVNELLERLIGYGPKPRPSEVLLWLHEREISTNTAAPRHGHYCDQNAGKLGLGMTKPFLEQAWPA